VKRIVICGSREYENYEEARLFLEETIGDADKNDVVILSGTCRGADRLGERFAKEKGIPLSIILRNGRNTEEWRDYGEMRKWQNNVTRRSAFGTEKAVVRHP